MVKYSKRSPMYAGSFYPSDSNELLEMIRGLLAEYKPKNVPGKLRALIIPHAGYIYSGPTAAFAYNLLMTASPSEITLFGPSHQAYLEGAFGFSTPWETPLGLVSVKRAPLRIIDSDEEHSLEVQLPFLQVVLKEFSLTPIIYGQIMAQELSSIISELHSNDSVTIISSDLSHYFSYDEAKKIDYDTIKSILELNFERFMRIGDACGKIGIGALILVAKENKWTPVLLDYRNSGDASKDKTSVVGYCAIAFME